MNGQFQLPLMTYTVLNSVFKKGKMKESNRHETYVSQLKNSFLYYLTHILKVRRKQAEDAKVILLILAS